jgi:hypothetical protein
VAQREIAGSKTRCSQRALSTGGCGRSLRGGTGDAGGTGKITLGALYILR